MIVLTKRLPSQPPVTPHCDIYLTAEERQKSRQAISLNHSDEPIHLQLRLPRGTILEAGDLLASDSQDYLVRVCAKPEEVLTVTAACQLDLIKAAYHLGNRHINLEIKDNYLRLLFDPVLANLLTQLGLNLRRELMPFYPEIGAYHSH